MRGLTAKQRKRLRIADTGPVDSRAERRRAVSARWSSGHPDLFEVSGDRHPLRAQHLAGKQCEVCDFYVKLAGSLGFDWGVCTNLASEMDGKLVFEHFTCPAWRFGPSTQWNPESEGP